ncbi:MAG TPA: DNA polymerase III subunit delta' [Usitatibacter sp.]|nr:DNA polymerase III subunit delta' [Usitatibacter sp.]
MALPWHRAPLKRILADRARLAHAFLVHGAPGIGKVEFARALAAGVLCESPRDGLACGDCVSCHWFAQGNHPDFREILPEAAAEDDEAEGEAEAKPDKVKSVVIKIDQIRAIADFVSLTTHRAGYRVLLLHPADALHPNAANALLKTLEEPPPHTLILLVTSYPARLLPTIRSRCRLLGLGPPDAAQAVAWLRDQSVDEPETSLAAAGGAPLLARDLAQPEEAELRRRVIAELSKPSGADALGFAAAIDRPRVERFVYWLQTWVNDLLLVRLAGTPRHHVACAAALSARAKTADVEALFELDRELAEARRLAAHPLNPRLLAEHLLMAYNRATLGAHP